MATLEYLTVGELLFEGYLKCSAGHNKEKIPSDELYITIYSDEAAMCWRGWSSIWFRGKEIAGEFMKHSDGTKLEGPSLELYHDAERWLLEHLSEII
jgi:hypothetical protein